MSDQNQVLIEALENDMLADALEKDLGLIRLAFAKVLTPNRLHHAVDRLLTHWGYRYQFECRKEIGKEVGYKSWLGCLVGSKSEYVFVLDDERYAKINSVINRMPPYYKAFARMHYEIPAEDEKDPLRYRNGRTVPEFVRYLLDRNKKNRVNSTLSTPSYYEDLREVKQLAIDYGII